MTDMSAGDHATQVNSDAGTFIIGTQISIKEVRQIGKDAARTVLLESWPIAEKVIDQRIEIVLNRLIEKIQQKDERLFQRFKDPRFLAALTSVERSFAETGDEELGEILTGLLTDLASKPVRSRRDIVLRQAVECAPKLTTNHLNALSVILRLTQMHQKWAWKISSLLQVLADIYSPYFGSLPRDVFDYEYMGSTEAGTYIPTIGDTVYDRLYWAHRPLLYEPFEMVELLDFLKTSDVDQLQAELNDIVSLLKLAPEDIKVDPGDVKKIKLDWMSASRIMSTDRAVTESHKFGENRLRYFLESRVLNTDEFKRLVHEQQPELSYFLDHLELTRALNFNLSPVGRMLARHEIESRSPETAAQLDALFEE